MSLFSVGLVLVVAILLAVGASLKTNIELVLKLKAVDRTLYEQLGSPRLIGYEWGALPGNKEYSRWLRHIAAVGDVSPYSVLARRLAFFRWTYWSCWVALVVVALLQMKG